MSNIAELSKPEHRTPIAEDAVVCLDGVSGEVKQSWGKETFFMPHGITVTSHHIWLTDVGTHQIYKFHKNGTQLRAVGTHLRPGHGNYKFCKPTDVLVDESSGDFYVSDGYCNSRVVRYNRSFGYLEEFGEHGLSGKMKFNLVHDLAQGPGGEMLISDRENGRIQVYDRITRKIVRIYSDAAIGPNVYASTYSPESATVFLGIFYLIIFLYEYIPV